VTFNPGLASAVNALDETGELEGKTIGVLLSDNLVDRSAVDEGLIPALESRGYELAAEATIPCDGAICDQYDPAAQRLKDAGIDALFSTVTAVSMPSFVAAGAAIDFAPRYYASPIGTQDIDVLTRRQEANADQYEGSLAVTPATREWTLPDGEPDPFGVECNQRYTDETGIEHEWGATEEAGWGAVYSICSMADQVQTALDDVGEDLTRERFIEALEGLSEFPSNSVGPGGYSQDKHYAATEVNILEWARDCSCWVATDGVTYPVVEE
jgi:ABC-type branched-subunit amino acid transport system substrate-binding protein